jgi:hypothetical protein
MIRSGISPPRFWRYGSSRGGRRGLSMTQRTCVGSKITFVQPQFTDGLDAGGDSDG